MGPMHIRRTARASALLLVAGLVLPLNACSGDGDAPESSTAPPSTAVTPSSLPSSAPSDVAAREALSAWRGMWQDMTSAAKTSDAQSPLLGRHASGKALQQLVSSLAKDRQEGVVTLGQIVLQPKVAKVSPAQQPSTVQITDCGDATDWLKYRAGTTQLKDDVPGGRHAMGGTVVQDDGDWKVTTFYAQDVGSC